MYNTDSALSYLRKTAGGRPPVGRRRRQHRLSGRPGRSLCEYGCAKSGVVALSEARRQEFAEHQVRVSVVELGSVDTELRDQNSPETISFLSHFSFSLREGQEMTNEEGAADGSRTSSERREKGQVDRGTSAHPYAAGEGSTGGIYSVLHPASAAWLDPSAVALFDEQNASAEGDPHSRVESIPPADPSRTGRHATRPMILIIGTFAVLGVLGIALLVQVASPITEPPTGQSSAIVDSPPPRAPRHTVSVGRGRPTGAARRMPSPTPPVSADVTPASPTPDAAREYYGWAFGLCLEVADSSRREGTRLQIAGCTGRENQRFTRSGFQEIRVFGDRCVAASSGPAAAKGDAVVTAECDGNRHQQWSLDQDGSVRQDGLCMDVRNGSEVSGAPIQLWDCGTGGDQEWWIMSPRSETPP
ncbi:SDR family NAD(P)-dependent oxidoreductase [Streptomyces sp. NPDC002730]|uniref:RICIN domain-containing protein n=1 Tax=Streptomyces sp. NPDC002730 TaxID=3364662 RepID=UPI00368B9174